MPYDVKAAMHWAEAHPWATGGIVLGGGLALLWLLGAFSKSNAGATDSGSNNAGAYYAAEAAQAGAGAAIQQSTLETAAATAQNQSNNAAMVAIDAANNVTSRVNSQGYFNMQLAGNLSDNATQVSLGSQATTVALGSQKTALGLGGQQLQATITQSNNALAAAQTSTAAAVKTEQIHATSAAYHDYLTTAMPAELAVGQQTAGFANFTPNAAGGYSVSIPPLAAPKSPTWWQNQGYSQADAYKLASKASGLTGKSSQSFRITPPANLNNIFKSKPAPSPSASAKRVFSFGAAPRNA
jgi:hypothetical protein